MLDQPLDFTSLATKYNDFASAFIDEHAGHPFFLYYAFSHVHTTYKNQPQSQYASCQFRNTTKRGVFGDALAEVQRRVSEWTID